MQMANSFSKSLQYVNKITIFFFVKKNTQRIYIANSKKKIFHNFFCRKKINFCWGKYELFKLFLIFTMKIEEKGTSFFCLRGMATLKEKRLKLKCRKLFFRKIGNEKFFFRENFSKTTLFFYQRIESNFPEVLFFEIAVFRTWKNLLISAKYFSKVFKLHLMTNFQKSSITKCEFWKMKLP